MFAHTGCTIRMYSRFKVIVDVYIRIRLEVKKDPSSGWTCAEVSTHYELVDWGHQKKRPTIESLGLGKGCKPHLKVIRIHKAPIGPLFAQHFDLCLIFHPLPPMNRITAAWCFLMPPRNPRNPRNRKDSKYRSNFKNRAKGKNNNLEAGQPWALPASTQGLWGSCETFRWHLTDLSIVHSFIWLKYSTAIHQSKVGPLQNII